MLGNLPMQSMFIDRSLQFGERFGIVLFAFRQSEIETGRAEFVTFDLFVLSVQMRIKRAFVPSLPIVTGSEKARLSEKIDEFSVLTPEVLGFLKTHSDRSCSGFVLNRGKMSTEAPSRAQQPQIVRLDPRPRSKEEFAQCPFFFPGPWLPGKGAESCQM